MNTPANDEVLASYHRCRDDGGFVDTFYDIFLAKSPEIAKMFEHTDFAHQKLMLRESLLEMLCLEQHMEGSRQEIQALGKRHQDLHITPEMYVMWLDSLCEAVEKHDPHCTKELTQKWRTAMQPGIELMLGENDASAQ